MDHYCELMIECLRDTRVQIRYNPQLREYFIPLLWKGKSVANQCLFYCPWCGDALPASLRNQYFDILATEYGVDDPFDPQQKKLIPDEFNSDAWWKNRNL